MNSFEYYNPVRILFGAGELKKVAVEAKKLGSRACVVSYKELAFLQPLMDKIEGMLRQDGMEVFPFYEVEQNPEIKTVKRGVEFCRSNQVNLVIGVGGGSAMDAAKAMALISGRNYATPEDVKSMRHSVLRHRIMLNFAAMADGIQEETIIDAIVNSIKTP